MICNIAAYHFVPIDDVDAWVDRLREQADTLALKGTILVAPEGLNLFLAGTEPNVAAFLTALRADARFADIQVKYSRSRQVPFARLKVKRKREIIAFRRDQASPLEQGRAPAVSPHTLKRWMAQGCDDHGRRLVLLDTRNREEVAYGSFAGAVTLPIDNFTDLPAAIADQREALADATVVSFCTGGIRCEKAALWMQAHGVPGVHQLDGGILGYFEQVGGEGYEGRCFVFDERVALDPTLAPMVDVDVDAAVPGVTTDAA
ncbi:sulfurtransferase [Oleiagrimonas sp. C23AA]|uniref:sulfurtransferase n=1 Tax=Oleiagrimonas sp. C23AA TaxID=2719047 RepID=UPI0014205132|nr:sulfurtransferase [Oleiagrimonas sp. C23AA]NII09601.1 sulfurtransferase [Oleiagrimonas sp. C23AA]